MNVLQWLKDRKNTGKYDIELLKNRILNFDVISFDIFDTLLKRNIRYPKDVFTWIESEIGESYPDFAHQRMKAEEKARQNTQREISIVDIYKRYDGLTEAQRKELISLEMQTESELLTLNIELKEVYHYCQKHGKKIVLISDMYLPKYFLERILRREGIEGYSKLFLSCEMSMTKVSGKLFQYALDDLGIDSGNMLHIGDSWISDYKIPKKLGIRAIHIPTHRNRSSYTLDRKRIELNILNEFINNHIDEENDNYYRFGYEKFGMLLWGYSKWLDRKLKEEGITKVYFFSRDGLIMKKAFDVLYSQKGVSAYYLEVSRRSLRIPVLWMDCSLRSVLNMISPSKFLPLRTLFEGVGLEIKDYERLINQYGFDKNTCFDRKTILNNTKLIQLYKELKQDIVSISKKEYEILVKYIEQNKLKGKFAIVDIGWSGGMQRYLNETLNRLGVDHKIKGYYLGVADYYKRNKDVMPELDLNGYLFDFMHDKKAKDWRSSFVGLFETLFLEQDGSVKNYSVNSDGMVVANRYPYEYREADGKFSKEYFCIQRLQQGAIDFMKDISENRIFDRMSFKAEELFEGVKRTGISPNRRDLKLFADFRFFDEGEIQYLAAPKSLAYYCLHPKALKNDFLLSRWKTGFLKRLLKVKLPYEKLYIFLLKFK